MPFGAIIARIPLWARTIYVMADSPSRQQYHPFSSRCGVILKGLFDALKNAFPTAIIVVKRGELIKLKQERERGRGRGKNIEEEEGKT